MWKELHDIREVQFGTFLFHGTVILKIKSQVWTSFESLASKKAKTWRLKGTSR